MTNFKVGDRVRIVEDSVFSSYNGKTGVLKSRGREDAPRGAVWFILLEDGQNYLVYETEIELIELIDPAPEVVQTSDLKTGDTVRISVEGKVDGVSGRWVKINGNEHFAGDFKIERIEKAPVKPKVGDPYSPGLPVGTVLVGYGETYFKTAEGWRDTTGYKFNHPHLYLTDKTISYLPDEK